MLTIIMSCFVFFAFVAFIIAHVLLASKRICQFFDRLNANRNPSSVDVTLNQMNITREDAEWMRTRHYDPTRGGRNAS